VHEIEDFDVCWYALDLLDNLANLHQTLEFIVRNLFPEIGFEDFIKCSFALQKRDVFGYAVVVAMRRMLFESGNQLLPVSGDAGSNLSSFQAVFPIR